MIEDGHLDVAGEHLKPEEFEVQEERKYTGQGQMLETENSLTIVHSPE
jgi:valyl-tRNA synthetase